MHLSKPIFYRLPLSHAFVAGAGATLANLTASVPRLINNAEQIVFVFANLVLVLVIFAAPEAGLAAPEFAGRHCAGMGGGVDYGSVGMSVNSVVSNILGVVSCGVGVAVGIVAIPVVVIHLWTGTSVGHQLLRLDKNYCCFIQI